MSNSDPDDPKNRLQDLGISVCLGGRSFPEGAMNGKGHLTIQTSGYHETDLDQALPVLHELAETFELEFLGDVSDDDLRHLASLHNLLSLKLNHRQVTDAGLRHLAGLTSLCVLELRGLPVTGAGVKHLAGLVNLSELHLWETQVDDAGAEVIAGLPELTVLDLNGCPVTDHCLEHLTRLTTLQTLTLSGTKIEGEGLALLGRLGNLESLNLNLLPITDREAFSLARLGKLQSLSLHGTKVGDQGAGWLAALPNLCWLTLSETRIGDDALRHLRSCGGLINVRLDGTRVTGAGLAHLPKDLAVLSLTGVDLKEADLAGLDRLESLSDLILDERIASKAVVGRLRRMHLARRPAYGEGVTAFSRLPACPLCRDVIEEDAPVFVPRPFFTGDEFWQYAEVPIHWDCFARWERRPEFARRYFRANAEAAGHNQFWGVARHDEQVLVTVNPSEYVEEVEVLLAETGSSFRVPLADWQGWLEGEWFERAATRSSGRPWPGWSRPSGRRSRPPGPSSRRQVSRPRSRRPGRRGWWGRSPTSSPARAWPGGPRRRGWPARCVASSPTTTSTGGWRWSPRTGRGPCWSARAARESSGPTTCEGGFSLQAARRPVR
jgi:hypothetical protein